MSEIFYHPELGVHVRGDFGNGVVGIAVLHGTVAMYEQETAEAVDRMCLPPVKLCPPAYFGAIDEGAEHPTVALPAEASLELYVGKLDTKGVSYEEEDSPLVGHKKRRVPNKKMGSIKDL